MMEIMDSAKLGPDIVRPKIPQIPKNLFGRSAQLARNFGLSLKSFHRVSVIRAKDDDAWCRDTKIGRSTQSTLPDHDEMAYFST